MKKKSFYQQAKELEEYYSQFPDWYWKFGLHDAKIVGAEGQSDGSFVFSLDGEGAIYERDIEEIRLINYKILDPDFDTIQFIDGWWLGDTLEKKGDHYVMDLRFATKKCKNRRVEIRFREAEVKRKSK